MSDTATTRIVRCCHCRGMMRVSARALSVFCPHCQKRVTLEDLRIVGSHPGKSLMTCGDIIVESTARLNLQVVGRRVTIHGRLNGSVYGEESIEIGRTGRVVGDIRSPKIVVQEGAVIEGRFEILRLARPPAVHEVPPEPQASADSPETSPSQEIPASPSPVPTGPRPRPLPIPPRPSRAETPQN